MHEQKNSIRRTEEHWNVMTHHKPQWIDAMLYKENRGELSATDEEGDESATEPFEFFVPFLFMRPDAADEIRSIFHNFVFVKASQERLRAIVESEWNKSANMRLRYYRDRSGKNITITDEEFQQLRATFLNRQLKVFFGMPVDTIGEMAVGDRVTLLIDGWKGKQGKIERIRLKNGLVSMTVAVDILGHTKSVNFEDLHDGDVIFADHDTEQLLTGNLISNMERPIATMLGHYFRKNNADVKRRDFPRLNRYLSYANIQVDDENEQKRFVSLMLLCATMLGETALCDRYAAQLIEWLSDEKEVDNVADACMLIALFVYTRHPAYRDAAKAFRKAHSDCPSILGTFINKVRDIPAKK